MYRFWAKTNEGRPGATYKPVSHHLLDVSACAFHFLASNPARLMREAALSGLLPKVHLEFCTVLAALHDLGKISRVFQAKSVDLWPTALLGAMPERAPQRFGHWEATAILLNAEPVRAALAPIFGESGPDVQVIAAVAGHHGVAPKDSDALKFVLAEPADAARHAEIGRECVEGAATLCRGLVQLFPLACGIDHVVQPPAFSFVLNGLITLADWVGSDAEFFGFESPETPLAAYWQDTLQKAGRALAAKGLLPAAKARDVSLAGISGHAATARPMQVLAQDLALPREPQLILIEDGTGSGKTEAALLLAQRMMATGLGEGLFVSLPTMATANAMHGRLEQAIGGLFGGPASLVLAHGKAAMAMALDRLASIDGGDAGEPTVSSHLNDWIGDSRKKAFYADAGAATIDQAFLSILPKKHLTLRQYALAGRILIIDEAHACDAYMGEELKTLVEMQARLGGSVIILSATLGQQMRKELLLTFALGRGLHPRRQDHLLATVRSNAYPLLTRWSASVGIEEIAVVDDPALARSVGIVRIDSRKEAVEVALRAAGQGGAVAVICNAVDVAIATWQALLAGGQTPDRCHLFHARFTGDDRLLIESDVQRWFGRNSDATSRNGRILVATQVVEQSLDVDFDLMISDLAPVDLVVQRAGRLWRHRRSDRPLAEPVLHLLSPDPGATVAARWLDDTLGAAAHVYKLPGVMWRTARDLFFKGRLETPGDLRQLIETAYAKEDSDLPPSLRDGHGLSLGEEYGKRAMGRRNTITPADGYMALGALSRDEEMGTRLGEKSQTIRLARKHGAKLVPLCRREGADDRLNWPLSEIAVRVGWMSHGAGGAFPAPADDALVEATRAAWPEWERGIPLFEVDGEGRLHIAGDTVFLYNAQTGLRRG